MAENQLSYKKLPGRAAVFLLSFLFGHTSSGITTII